MKLLNKLKKLVTNRELLLERLLYYIGSDRLFIKLWFKSKMGYYPNLNDPKTYNEKLQWLKINYHKPLLTTLVDKYSVKKYVAEIIGEKYIIPTLGVWNDFDEIDFDSLPNQFVLKCTHDSGGLVICKDKARLDKAYAKKKINKSLKTDFYKLGREWPYKNVPRRIIAEQYLEEVSIPNLTDAKSYRILCVKGSPIFCQLYTITESNQSNDYYNIDLNHWEITRQGLVNQHKSLSENRPENYVQILEISKLLSKGIPVSRIDLYNLNKTEYFAEMTIFPEEIITTDLQQMNKTSIMRILNSKDYEKRGYRVILNNKDIQLIPVVGELRDYKFFCFDGRVKCLFVATERQNREEPYFDFFDTDFNHLDMRHGHPNAPFKISKPKNFELMKELASKLSRGFPHVRIDLYEVNGKVYFGEMTFFHHSGCVSFDPIKWDSILGKEITLPISTERKNK